MVENAWWPPSNFWIENSNKSLVVVRCFLDAKCFKMLGGYQAFSGSKMLENVSQLLNIFWIKNARKCLVATRHFLNHKWWSLRVFGIENYRKRLAATKIFLD